MPDQITTIAGFAVALSIAAALWLALWLVSTAPKRRMKRLEKRLAYRAWQDSVPDDLKLGFLDRLDGLK